MFENRCLLAGPAPDLGLASGLAFNLGNGTLSYGDGQDMAYRRCHVTQLGCCACIQKVVGSKPRVSRVMCDVAIGPLFKVDLTHLKKKVTLDKSLCMYVYVCM